MSTRGLAARIGYALVALPMGGAVGFYSTMLVLPRVVARWPKMDPSLDGLGIFNLAISVGVALAFSATLFALTLPGRRHRKRRGRTWRISLSCVVVVTISVVFADLGHRLVYDLIFAVWLSYMMAYTFVRYGVIDQSGSGSGNRRKH